MCTTTGTVRHMTSSANTNPWDLDDPSDAKDTPTQWPAPVESDTGLEVLTTTTAPAPAPAAAQTSALTPAATRTLSDLLDLGTERPVSPPDLQAQLKELLLAKTQIPLETWPERNLWVSKSSLMSFARCQGTFKANKEIPWSGLVLPVAVGQVAHRAIQISYTHPGLGVEIYVKSAITAQCDTDQPFNDYWNESDIAVQSDVITRAVSKTTAFLDSWPTLAPEWYPRFEESTTARIGKLTLSVRPDLVLGRPRADMRQTMILCDFKTGDLKEEHDMEASIYALVSTLRHGVAPFKSVVYSLSSGEWVSPEITADMLMETAEFVAASAASQAQVLLETAEPVLTAGAWCTWCPLAASCVAHAEYKEDK